MGILERGTRRVVSGRDCREGVGTSVWRLETEERRESKEREAGLFDVWIQIDASRGFNFGT